MESNGYIPAQFVSFWLRCIVWAMDHSSTQNRLHKMLEQDANHLVGQAKRRYIKKKLYKIRLKAVGGGIFGRF